MTKVSAIIVNFNTGFLVERFVKNLKDAYQNLEIIFVNNSPEDGATAVVKGLVADAKTLELKNPGLSVGYNNGVKNATSDLLLFIGTDAFPTNEVVVGMVDYMQTHEDTGIVTTALVMENGEIDLDSHRGLPNVLSSIFKFTGVNKLFPHSKFFNSYFMGHLIGLKIPHEIDATISHLMLVKKSVFEKIGGFDEDYFLYGEDIDFCYRVKQAGYKVIYLPQYKTLHLKGVSLGTRKHNKKEMIKPYSYRKTQVLRSTEAMRLFVQKHYSRKYNPVFLQLTYLSIFLLGRLRVFIEWIDKDPPNQPL